MAAFSLNLSQYIKSPGYIHTYIFKKGENQRKNEKVHLPSNRSTGTDIYIENKTL